MSARAAHSRSASLNEAASPVDGAAMLQDILALAVCCARTRASQARQSYRGARWSSREDRRVGGSLKRRQGALPEGAAGASICLCRQARDSLAPRLQCNTRCTALLVSIFYRQPKTVLLKIPPRFLTLRSNFSENPALLFEPFALPGNTSRGFAIVGFSGCRLSFLFHPLLSQQQGHRTGSPRPFTSFGQRK